MVPMLAALNPSAVQICRANTVTDVLPLVPVTAAMVPGWRGWTLAAASASACLASATRTKATPSGSGEGGGVSATIATAPAASAAGTNCRPSALVPGTATNASPGLTLRLSAAAPPTRRSPWRSANAASGKRSRRFMASRSLSPLPGGERSDREAIRVRGFLPYREIVTPSPRPSPLRGEGVPRAGLAGVLAGRKDQLVGGRQVETRLEPEDRGDAGDHLAGGRHRVPARGGEAVGFRRRLR